MIAIRNERRAGIWCAAAAMVLTVATPARARPPQKVGECAVTTIKEIGDRFGDRLPVSTPTPSSGTLVSFANGGVQVSYQWESVIARSRIGDRVRMCLIEIPGGCPPGDMRGKVYSSTTLREAWTLSDSQHLCGGA